MKIIVNENETKIQFETCECTYFFSGKYDVLELKNRLLSLIEISFEKEIAELLIAGTFSKYKNN